MVDYGNFQSDSHGMFGSRAGLPIWLPQVDAFLRELGLPSGPAPSSKSVDASTGSPKDTQ
jgi:hypothetical protein